MADALEEPDETFTVVVDHVTGATVVRGAATVTITPPPPPPEPPPGPAAAGEAHG
ncbi:MAG: hypothetical protein R2731_14565 [Nocardioides sp.]